MSSKKFRLVLASQSPRRREILESAGFACLTFPSNSSESFDENLNLRDNLCAIARDKILTVLAKLSTQKQKGILLLAADTVVVVKGQVLGKPRNKRDARRMLRLLSGKTHSVKTAFSFFCPDQKRGVTRIVTTKVGFHKLSESDIQCYIQTNEPFDKAGAYAIQGLASQFVNFVNGDLLNVVGLPLGDVKAELRKQRWNVALSRKSSKRDVKSRRR